LVAVLDATIIIGLAKVEIFSPLADLYASLSVPPELSEEVQR
jgi:hypothetical protein